MTRLEICLALVLYAVTGAVLGYVASDFRHRNDVCVLPLPTMADLPYAPRSAALLPQAYALPTP